LGAACNFLVRTSRDRCTGRAVSDQSVERRRRSFRCRQACRAHGRVRARIYPTAYFVSPHVICFKNVSSTGSPVLSNPWHVGRSSRSKLSRLLIHNILSTLNSRMSLLLTSTRWLRNDFR
jgi:hypothetical protein